MENRVETITVGDSIPVDVALQIRTFISRGDYLKVAEMHKESIDGEYLRMVVYHNRPLTKKTIEPVKTLMRMAIQCAQSVEFGRQKILDYLGEDESEALRKLNEQAA